MTFVLAHLSDAHIGPLPRPQRRELIGKRLTGYLNWRSGRDRIHDMEVLGRLVADMRAHKPDHVAMTGDVLNIGLPAEFPLASRWLHTLGDPDSVSFVPGNHDAYVRGALAHIAGTFGPWTEGASSGRAQFPYCRRRGDIALIGLSSGVPTAPFLASGKLGAEQIEGFNHLMQQVTAEKLCRIVMIHHPPLKSGTSAGRGLVDARAFESVLARYGAELVIHGHNHRFSVARFKPTKGPPVPVVGVPSASAVPGTPKHCAAYHLYEFRRGEGGWTIEGRSRGYSAGSREIGDLAAFTL